MNRIQFLSLTFQATWLGSLAVTHAYPAFKPVPQKQNDPDLDQLLPQLLKDWKTPAVSVAIIKDGKMSWNKAFGVKDTATNEQVDVDTTFEAASISKTVFACAVMKLCEKKIMNLDAPLATYYPELFAKGDTRLQMITARQVLSHQSGLTEWRHAPSPTFQSDPTREFNYSGEGYYLLQTVLTHLVGKAFTQPCETFESDYQVCATDFADYMQRTILDPFGMTSSSYLWSEKLAKNHASAHDVQAKPFVKKHQQAVDMARYGSAGGLLTTAKDYAEFLINLFEGKDNDPYRLNSSSLQEMFRPQIKLRDDQKVDECNAWALGWGIRDLPTGRVVIHSGGQSGFKSLAIASIDKRSGFVALTNGDNGGHVIYRLADALGYPYR